MNLLKNKGIRVEDFAVNIGMAYSSFKGNAKYTPLNSNALGNILSYCRDVNPEWLLTGKGNMLKEENQLIDKKREFGEIGKTRPRIPYDAPAGSLSVGLDGLAIHNCEQLPIIRAFPKYDFTILTKGDGMLSEFHPGDELACLYIKSLGFVQWGQFHVLDTSQGVIVKRIFDDGEYILCRSENSGLYKDFKVHKSEVYNIALVIGLIRQY